MKWVGILLLATAAISKLPVSADAFVNTENWNTMATKSGWISVSLYLQAS
jgi:hypothetical protein